MSIAVVHRLGLTGGIGSGKSTVAELLRRHGAAVVDADAVSRELTAPGGLAIAAISKRLGKSAISADGSMSRDVVRALVLQNAAVKQQLESIIHPLVASELTRLAALALQAHHRVLVFDIPLLVESGRWRSQLDAVLVVDCQVGTQVKRVMAREALRGGWTVPAVERIIALQASRAQRLAAADVCLYNDGVCLAGLAALVNELACGFGL